MLVGFLLRFFYEPQAVSSSTRDIVVAAAAASAVGLYATYFHGSAATSIQRDARGGGKGGAWKFCGNVEIWAFGWLWFSRAMSVSLGCHAMLIAKAFVMPSHTNSHPTMVLCHIKVEIRSDVFFLPTVCVCVCVGIVTDFYKQQIFISPILLLTSRMRHNSITSLKRGLRLLRGVGKTVS